MFLRLQFLQLTLFYAIILLPGWVGAQETASCMHCQSPKVRTIKRAKAIAIAAAALLPAKDTGAMVFVPGGRFRMGSNDLRFDDTRPVHDVTVSGFYMDAHEVTNAQFAAFVQATGYKTVAEQALDTADYPGVPAAQLLPGAAVFTPPAQRVSLNDPLQWWRYVPGACWAAPLGRSASAAIQPNEPVTQVAYPDAVAYATWAGKRLPTEAEWEYAARGGADHIFYWGDSLMPGGKWAANIFQGTFPNQNSAADGYAFLAPVQSYRPNAYGLFDMEGNVWEWCADLYRPDYYAVSPAQDPAGPADSYDPYEPGVVKRVQRGGSFLCSDAYCLRYRSGSRGKGEENSASNNLGFRCVRDADPRMQASH